MRSNRQGRKGEKVKRKKNLRVGGQEGGEEGNHTKRHAGGVCLKKFDSNSAPHRSSLALGGQGGVALEKLKKKRIRKHKN